MTQLNLQKIDHIVGLMLENRSFDSMLGWLYDPANDPPFDRVPAGQSFNGLSGKQLSNPIPAYAAEWNPGWPGCAIGLIRPNYRIRRR